MDNFEELLKTRDIVTGNTVGNESDSPRGDSVQIKKQTSDKSATLYDFIKMIQKVVSLTMKDLNVEMVPDEGKLPVTDTSTKVDHPYITYKLIKRKPKEELKPRHREEVIEKTKDKDSVRIGSIYGQKFECILQFNIFASVYDTAEKVMEKFEETMFTYSGYFKKNGVGEILFREQLTDDSLNHFRQTTSIRSLTYYVEVEKLFILFKDSIKDIEVFEKKE